MNNGNWESSAYEKIFLIKLLSLTNDEEWADEFA